MKNFYKLPVIFLLFASLAIPSLAQYQQYYDVQPNVSNCSAGELKQSEKDKILTLLNKIRSLHDLPPVEYASSFDDEAAEISLIIVANFHDHGFSQTNHTPPKDWHCWSQTGYDGGVSSNLFYSSGTPASEISVISWLNDRGVNVLGHRRWMLDPFVKKIAFGRADGIPINGSNLICGMALYYDSKNQTDLSSWNKDFVAFPYGNYPPSYFDKNWSVFSFTVVADKSDRWNNKNKVSFETTQNGDTLNKVQIEIEDSQGNVKTYSPDVPGQVGWNYDMYGVPNCLIWQVLGLRELETYTVRIKNVRVNGQNRNFEYQFALRDPFQEKPGKPSLTYPPNNAENVSPNLTFKWNAATGASSYILQISNSQNFGESDIVYTNERVPTNSYQISGVLLAKHRYYWRVAGKNDAGQGQWSDVWNFKTTDAPSVPQLVAPPNNSVNQPLTVSLQWNEVDLADSYRVQVSEDETFGESLIDERNLSQTSYQVESGLLSPKTKYYWRVQAISDVSGESPWSEIWNFTTAASAPGKPVLISPKRGARDVSAKPELVWSSVPGATSYDLQIAESQFYNDWETKLNETGIKDTTFRVPPDVLDFETQYFWRVRAEGPGGKGEWSRNGRFITGDASSAETREEPIASIQAYPNPFSEKVEILLSLKKKTNATLCLYDELGHKVLKLIDGVALPGEYYLNIEKPSLPSGVYRYVFESASLRLTGKIVKIK